ncbi:MAG: hypothetical protein ABFS28_15270 [Bacteroidota bacterium]
MKMKNEISKSQGTGSNKKTLWILSMVSISLLAVFAVVTITRENKHVEETTEAQLVNEDLSGIIEHRDSIINELVQTFNEIEADLNVVREKENLLALSADNPEFPNDMRERIVKEIREMNSLLEENKAKVISLNKRLKKSGIKIAALEDKIGLLDESIQRRDSSIQVLKMELSDQDFQLAELYIVLDSMDTVVDERDSTIQFKEEVISQNETELDKAYLASGNFKELQEIGVVSKEGGFLGLGKNKVVPADLTDSFFNQISISETARIAINAKKAELISAHPEDSYQVISNDSIVEYIEITQPEKFWKKTRYAVVETR